MSERSASGQREPDDSLPKGKCQMGDCAGKLIDFRDRVREQARRKLLDELLVWFDGDWHGAYIINYGEWIEERVLDYDRFVKKLESLRQGPGGAGK